MYQTIDENDFRRAFGRIRPNQFSHEGLGAIFEHLEVDDVELDVIAICCEYTEYFSIEEYNEDYGEEHSYYEDIEETVVIPVNDEQFIILQY